MRKMKQKGKLHVKLWLLADDEGNSLEETFHYTARHTDDGHVLVEPIRK